MCFRPQAELLKSLLLATLALVACGVVAAEPIAITGGTLIDGNGGQPVANATVVVRDDRIVAVGPAGAVEIPADAKRYDATGKYLLPGILGREAELGTLEPGKLADLQIVDANPLESFQPLGRPSLVMIGGAVVRHQGRR